MKTRKLTKRDLQRNLNSLEDYIRNVRMRDAGTYLETIKALKHLLECVPSEYCNFLFDKQGVVYYKRKHET